MENTEGGFRSAYFGIPGARTERSLNDWMHGQHLGTGQHIVGSTLVVLCKDEKKFGNFDLATSLKHAWLEFKAWCKFRSIPCSMSHLHRLAS